MKFNKKWMPLLCLQFSFSLISGCFADGRMLSFSFGMDGEVAAEEDLRRADKDALIFNGEGASEVDARSIASILADHGRTYEMVSSSELDALSLDELLRFRMIVVPGGYGGKMTQGLQSDTRERVRKAIVEHGVNYVGFCAGAFVAVGPTPPKGGAPAYGFSIVPAPQLLDYYYPNKDGDDDVAASLPIAFADGSKRQIFFWGGPALFEIQGGVVARYSDGTPAIVQVRSGKAFVTIAGPHPEGPREWKDTAGVEDPDGEDFDIAWNLFESTLRRIPLKAF